MNFDKNTFFSTKNLPKITFFDQIKTTNFPSPQDEFFAKKEFNSKFGPDIINKFAIDKIKSFVNNDIILQIDAGLGLFAAFLKQEKINIFPIDNRNIDNRNSYCDIINMDYIKAINLIKTNTLFITHPTPNSAEILDIVKLFEGDKFIYIQNENPNHDKLLNEYIFRKFYVAQKCFLPNFGKNKTQVLLLKRK